MNPYIKLPKVPVVYGRQDVILTRCRDKQVLHLGCADEGHLYERFKRGELMHQRLGAVSKELWGVDIDEKGIDYLRCQGFGNLLVGDVCTLDRQQALRNRFFDVIVVSEVLEHLQNPGFFLEGVKRFMKPGETELIVTVPNAFRIDNLFWLFRGVEYVHPDHYYWFSYYTACHLLEKKGFDVKSVTVYSFQNPGILPKKDLIQGCTHPERDKERERFFVRKGMGYVRALPKRLITSFLLKRTPFWGDGIILVARIEPYAE
jgi:SAM-dependent methyltransferase